MIYGNNYTVIEQITYEELAKRIGSQPKFKQVIDWPMRINYFPSWPVDTLRNWLGDKGLDSKMPVEEHYVRVALVTSKGVVMVGNQDSDMERSLAFFDTPCEWYDDFGACARKTLWDAVRCSTVSLTKVWDEIKDIEDENGNKIRRVISVYIKCINYPKGGFCFCNEDLVLITEADDPRVAPEDRNSLKVLLDCYYKPLSKG